jgi:hypothetical protein
MRTTFVLIKKDVNIIETEARLLGSRPSANRARTATRSTARTPPGKGSKARTRPTRTAAGELNQPGHNPVIRQLDPAPLTRQARNVSEFALRSWGCDGVQRLNSGS